MSEAMTSVTEFLYRLPRFDVRFGLELLQDEATVAGRCVNLSHTGMLAQFDYPPGTGSTGRLRLDLAGRVFELRAHVTHSEGLRAGLQFDFASDQERQVIRALVEAIARQAAAER